LSRAARIVKPGNDRNSPRRREERKEEVQKSKDEIEQIATSIVDAISKVAGLRSSR
jgi:hypothetical protein